jgi:hypothetical protein
LAVIRARTRGLDYNAAHELQDRLSWPEGWPLPLEGQTVELPNERIANLYVRHVAWYPMGDEDDTEPYVYLVLGGRPL